MATQKIKLNWKEAVHFESEGPGGNVLIDGSEEVGGQGKGVRPKALMLSALAGCSGIDIASLFKKMRVAVDTFSIDVEAELTDEHPKYYQKVWVTFNFYGKDLDKKKIEKAVNLSVDKYCGVMEMFRQFAKVETEIVYHEA
ncbi:OsmC family protein [Ochrovirga pacifica]|uniref:OsmC family protein n=1 Tax=Ochrovirga pacifica TaxID=1042376 RepID=UPI000255A56F|nr:OsmC family protein [Ochrovirga pacifica]